MAKLIDIEGIGEVYAGKLNEAGLQTVEDLLKACETPADRKALAEKTGISVVDGTFGGADEYLARVRASQDGGVTDAKTLSCLLWVQNVRAGLWRLDWQKA